MSSGYNVSWSYQLWRLRFRAYVMVQAFCAALFWFALAVLSGTLNQSGLGWIAWVIVGLWAFFAIPGLLFQIQTIADIASYLLTGRTNFYPAMRKRIESGEIERQFAELSPRVRKASNRLFPIVVFAAATSPLSAVAAWGSIVLARLPSSAHEPAPKPTPPYQYATFTFARQQHRKFEAAVYEDIVDRLLGRRMSTAA